MNIKQARALKECEWFTLAELAEAFEIDQSEARRRANEMLDIGILFYVPNEPGRYTFKDPDEFPFKITSRQDKTQFVEFPYGIKVELVQRSVFLEILDWFRMSKWDRQMRKEQKIRSKAAANFQRTFQPTAYARNRFAGRY